MKIWAILVPAFALENVVAAFEEQKATISVRDAFDGRIECRVGMTNPAQVRACAQQAIRDALTVTTPIPVEEHFPAQRHDVCGDDSGLRDGTIRDATGADGVPAVEIGGPAASYVAGLMDMHNNGPGEGTPEESRAPGLS